MSREGAPSPREGGTSSRDGAIPPREGASPPRESATSPREGATGDGRDAAVLCNPLAGGGRAPQVARRAVERLTSLGYTTSLHLTTDRSGARPLATELQSRAELGHPPSLVVVAGGDGTLRETIDGLGAWSDRIPVGVVPLGNANVVARELGIPRDLERAVELACTGRPMPMDVGTLNVGGETDLFLAMVGIGWDAHVVRLIDRVRHSPSGRLLYRTWADGLYGATGLLAALRRDDARFRATVDGEPLDDAYVAAWICNLRTYGKGMTVAPSAGGRSGRLHAQLRYRPGALALGRQLVHAVRGDETPPSVATYVEGTRFRLESDRPFAYQVDGDFRGWTSTLDVGVRVAAALVVDARDIVPLPSGSRASNRPAPGG